ncbi:MAG: putative protein N(5)-glutamine methyltransferase [Nocardioidaceae bacterium]|nr:putative protein N(5)-glutamine methyltransferase [Nocardioidaceae bacterium]
MRALRAGGSVFAEEEAAEILRHGLSDSERDEVVRRRTAGVPLEHLLGSVALAGLDLRVDAGLFVPRARTGLLSARAVSACRTRPGAVFVELCCGVAPLAAAVERAGVADVLVATDVDPRCAPAASANVPTALVGTGDLFDGVPSHLRGRLDVVAAVPPYVPDDDLVLLPPEARDHEPRGALLGGPDGLDVVRRMVGRAPEWLSSRGVLLVEVSRAQAPAAIRAGVDAGLVAERLDLRADRTAVVSWRAGGPDPWSPGPRRT